MYRGNLGTIPYVDIRPDCLREEAEISADALQELRDMQAQDIQQQQTQPVDSANVSDSNQPGYNAGLNPCPPKSGIYWTGIFILAGCIAGAIVIRKVRK
jgi:hypothetical protein